MYENERFVINEITHPSEADGKVGQVDLIGVCHSGAEVGTPGIPHVQGGGAMVDCIITAVEMAKVRGYSGCGDLPYQQSPDAPGGR